MYKYHEALSYLGTLGVFYFLLLAYLISIFYHPDTSNTIIISIRNKMFYF